LAGLNNSVLSRSQIIIWKSVYSVWHCCVLCWRI